MVQMDCRPWHYSRHPSHHAAVDNRTLLQRNPYISLVHHQKQSRKHAGQKFNLRINNDAIHI